MKIKQNINDIKNLIQNVAIIQKKYDDLSEYSGEHYNVFEILGVSSSELSHSAVLANLLDAKGKHGQKDAFLKLFIEQIKPSLEKSKYNEHINSFDTEKATANKEIYIGGVNSQSAEGGRVDIVISSGNKNIIIENKIYAADQYQQLLRYDNHYKNDPIIYLTLYGEEPTQASKGDLVLGKDFICCSYYTDISIWLEKCIKEMANKPIIRETLNQYLHLIKRLTDQSNNNKMSDEIKKTILSSKENIIGALNVYYSNPKQIICEELFNRIKRELITDCEKYNSKPIGQKDSGMWLSKENHILLWFELNYDKLELGKVDENFSWIEKPVLIENFNDVKWEDILDDKNVNELIQKIKKSLTELELITQE